MIAYKTKDGLTFRYQNIARGISCRVAFENKRWRYNVSHCARHIASGIADSHLEALKQTTHFIDEVNEAIERLGIFFAQRVFISRSTRPQTIWKIEMANEIWMANELQAAVTAIIDSQRGSA